MLVDIISVTQIFQSTLDQTLKGLAAISVVPEAAAVLKDRDSKKKYVWNHVITLQQIINRHWKVDFKLSLERLKLIRGDPLFMYVYLLGAIVIYRQKLKQFKTYKSKRYE